MNLILQGIRPDDSTIQRLAAMAGASSITQRGVNAWVCNDTDLPDEGRAVFAQACFEAQVDFAFETGRRLDEFRLLAMDMDSTLINIECIDEIADMQGIKPQVAEITEAAMRGELDFSQSLRRRVALLKGLETSALDRVYAERLCLNPGAEALLAAAKKAGLKTLLVSGGFTFFTDKLKDRLGLDYTASNLLEMDGGHLTGAVQGEIVDAHVKRRMVEQVCAENSFNPCQAIVMGDGANDLEMMGVAGLSVAYHAKPKVQKQAHVALNFVGLDGVLNIVTP